MPANEAPRLLVVEDEPDMLYGLRRILGPRLRRRGGREGEDAIQKAQAQVPHDILMDMKMTGMSSVEAYRDIRVLAPHACIIFMTAYSELSDAAQMETPVAVFSKPLELDYLHLVIEQAVHKLGTDQASKA